MIVSRNPFFKSASGWSVFAQMPFAEVASAIIFILHQLRENAEPPIKRLVRQIEDDNSDVIFNVCESLGGKGDEERRIGHGPREHAHGV